MRNFYKWILLQTRREDSGLQAAFLSVFPIVDYNETASIEFLGYTFSDPKYDLRDCLQKGITYAAPLKIKVKLNLWEFVEPKGSKRLKESREEDVYIGEMPLMTDIGTFVINGTERVVVSQLHRSPGVFFSHDKGKTHASGRLLYSARVIPSRGSWLDFEFDTKDILYVRIDRRRKLPATIVMKALGYSNEDLLKIFYPVETIQLSGNKFSRAVSEVLVGLKSLGQHNFTGHKRTDCQGRGQNYPWRHKEDGGLRRYNDPDFKGRDYRKDYPEGHY